MVTTVTVPKEKATPAGLGNPRDADEHLVGGRALVERTQAFVEDASVGELVNWGAGPSRGRGLPSEVVEEWTRNGQGTLGLFTVVEPADLDLYRSYIGAPLSMPDKPEVSVILVDYHRGNPVTRYQEGWIMVKAKTPGGKEGWFSVSVPVPTLLMCYMGIAWGIPKYVADEMTVTPTKAEVKFEGTVRLSMELAPGHVDDEDALKERRMFGMDNALTFHPKKDGSTCLINWFGRGGDGSRAGVVEWQTGMVKVYVRPEDPWAGLIPTDSAAPGVYQRVVPTGGGDFVWQKVKS